MMGNIAKFSHIFRLGQDCTTESFCEWMSGKFPVDCPFTKSYSAGLESMVDLVCARGKKSLDFEDLYMAEYKNPWNPSIRNRRTGQMFPHDWFPQACADWNAIRRSYPIVRQKMLRLYDSMCAVLDDALSNVLLVYIGYGDLYTQVYGYPAMLGNVPWYSLEIAQRCIEKLRSSFKSNITLLYLDVPAEPSARKNELTCVTPHLITGTHSFAPYSWNYLRASIFAAEFSPSLRRIWGDVYFPKLDCASEVRLLPVKTPHWHDIVCVNPSNLSGYRSFNKDPFTVLQMTEDLLEVKWLRWSRECFTRIPSKDFPVWERKTESA